MSTLMHSVLLLSRVRAHSKPRSAIASANSAATRALNRILMMNGAVVGTGTGTGIGIGIGVGVVKQNILGYVCGTI